MSGLQSLTEAGFSAMQHLPESVKSNVAITFGRLCSAAIDWPTAWLEGKAADHRSNTAAREHIAIAAAAGITTTASVPDAYAKRAMEKYAAKIVGEQINLDDITQKAFSELTQGEDIGNTEEKLIDEDWLNAFESHAREMTTEEMRIIFGKILANEIKKPGNFSRKTLSTIAQLDNDVAITFQKLCACIVSIGVSNVVDARMLNMDGDPGNNCFAEYGLHYRYLTNLEEYGLINSAYSNTIDYRDLESLFSEDDPSYGPIYINEIEHYLVCSNKQVNMRFAGVSLTKTGKEIYSVLSKDINEQYFDSLKAWLRERDITLEAKVLLGNFR